LGRAGFWTLLGEALGLILADVLRSQAIGRAVEVLGEPLDEANVTLCGSFRVNDVAGVPPASFCVDGSQGPPCDPQLSEPKIRTADITHAASVRRAKSFVLAG
jgi:hypothetical protein